MALPRARLPIQDLNPNDAQYFNPSEQDRRIAGARREGPVPTVEEIKRVLNAMPSQSPVEKRDRALVAFALLSGARDGAMVTFRLKHLDLTAGTIFQDGREVKTKRRKTFTSHFFPVRLEPLEIVADYVNTLITYLHFRAGRPLVSSNTGRTIHQSRLRRDGTNPAAMAFGRPHPQGFSRRLRGGGTAVRQPTFI